MNINDYILSLGIDPDGQYSIKEAAAKVGKSPRTLQDWCRYGLHIQGRGPIVLARFYLGRSPVIPGRCLIEFLAIKNENMES